MRDNLVSTPPGPSPGAAGLKCARKPEVACEREHVRGGSSRSMGKSLTLRSQRPRPACKSQAVSYKVVTLEDRNPKPIPSQTRPSSGEVIRHTRQPKKSPEHAGGHAWGNHEGRKSQDTAGDEHSHTPYSQPLPGLLSPPAGIVHSHP